MSFGGITLASGAGALTFTSSGTGGAKTVSIGTYGITNSSSSALTFDISSKVNVALSANASFTADGPIVINDATATGYKFGLGSYTLTLTGTSNSSNIAQEFNGTGGVVKSGTGTWTLSGPNGYTGSTTLNAGKLSVSTLANGGTASNLGMSTNAAANLVFNGGTLQYTGAAGSTDRLFTLGSGGGVIEASGSGALALAATGGVAFSGSNTSPVLTLTGTNTGNNTLSAFLGNNGTGSSSLTKTGAGTWVLTGANTLSGTVTVLAGTLTVNAGASLAGSTSALVINGGTLNLNQTAQTVASLAGSAGALNLGTGHTLTVNQATATGFGGAIGGSGSLTKSGAGTLVLSGVNTLTGATTVSGGTLQFTKQTSLYNNTPANWTATKLIVNSGATAAFNVGGTGEFTATDIDILKGLGTASGGFKSGSFIGFDTTNASGGVFAYNSNIANPNGGANVLGLVKLGAGTLLLGGSNTYSGDTFVKAGTLKLATANALSPNTKLVVANGAAFDAGGFAPVFSDLSGSGSLSVGSAGLAVQPAGISTFSGVLSGTGGFTMNGTGTLTLANANSFEGATTISAGKVILGAPGALPSGTPLTLATGAILDLNGNNATVGKLEGAGTVQLTSGATLAVAQTTTTTFTGTITGNGGLSKAGTGLLILSGTHAFTGATTIADGELKINGSAASSPFTVSGGILSGSGTVGTLTVANGGTLAPGSSPGLLNVSGDLTLSGTTALEIGGTARGTGGYDAIDVGGAISFGGALNISFIDGFSPVGGQSFDFFNWTGSASGTFSGINLPALSAGLAWDSTALYSSGILSVTGTAVPEPSAYAAIVGAALLAFALWRRSKSRAGRLPRG